VLGQTALLCELILVHEHVVIHLLSTHAAHAGSVLDGRPLAVEAQSVLGHVALQYRNRVVAEHEETLLVRVLLVGVNGCLEEKLNVLLLVFGKTLGVIENRQNLCALTGGWLGSELGQLGSLCG
jgi:hypothetical protein